MLFIICLQSDTNPWTAKSYCKINGSNANIYPGEPTNESQYDAKAEFSNFLFQDGWFKLHVIGSTKATSENMLYCAGFLEGNFSHEAMFNHFTFLKEMYNNTNMKEIYNFLEENYHFTEEAVNTYLDVPYWIEIGLILKQFQGLVAGYDQALGRSKMSLIDHWFLQSVGDVMDISEKFVTTSKEFEDHCTGLVKITSDYDDIFFAHAAWSDFRELFGELKEYYFPIPEFSTKTMTLSTRIGKLSSYDDFYTLDSGLYVLETTNANFNMSLYDLVQPRCLFTWIRAVHACWIAKNGSDWALTFVKYNSGTYNNQYVILDTNKFTKGEKPTTDLLWIVEQFPITYRMTDVTYQLVQDSYFPSFNCPWHEDLYKLAGYPQAVASMGKYGDLRSYYHSPRYEIMKRDAYNIKTFDEFRKFMRYNNWKHDKYAQDDPGQQIASRYDLRPDSGTPYGPKKAFGALDAKCVKWSQANSKLLFHAIQSPTYDQNPVFEFNESFPDINVTGILPKRWEFPWINFSSLALRICEKFTTKSDCLNSKKSCGWCTEKQLCWPGDKDGNFVNETCDSDCWITPTTVQNWAVPVVASVSSVVIVVVCLICGFHFFTSKKQ